MSPAMARPQAEHRVNGASRGTGAEQATQWVGKTSSRKAAQRERSMAGLYRERRKRGREYFAGTALRVLRTKYSRPLFLNHRHDGQMPGCGRISWHVVEAACKSVCGTAGLVPPGAEVSAPFEPAAGAAGHVPSRGTCHGEERRRDLPVAARKA